MRKIIIFNFLFVFLICSQSAVFAQDHGHEGHDHSTHENHDHSTDDHDTHSATADSHDDHGAEAHGDSHHGHSEVICGVEVDHSFEVGKTAMHHIGDANVYSIGPLQLPLPVIAYSNDGGLDIFSTAKFKADLLGHGDGHAAYNGYVLHEGSLKRVAPGQNFPNGEVKIAGFVPKEEIDAKEKKKEVMYVCDFNELYRIENKSTADAGLFGGGITSFYDFSPTKNVVSMILVTLFLGFVFRRVAKSYKTREGKEPKGLQSFMETFVVFIRDEVAKPFLGNKWEKYFSLLLAIFFFILGLNLFGQIPFFGGSNVTGNLAVTMVLAIIAFLVTNISGNGHYWKHLLAAPGVPWFVKPILIPIEIMGIFIKPLTLMLRLFANITAGHIVLVVFVSLIFIFGDSGQNVGGALGASVGSTLLTLFMMAIELIVALVQAFVFTILTASYIGAATEEVEHH